MTFEWPWMLWGLGALPLLAWLVLIPNVALLAQAASSHSRWRRWVPPVLYLLTLATIVIGFARPVAPLPVPASEGVVVLSVDTSRSMLAEDYGPYPVDIVWGW
jgi:Ca-activated chloride channel family protein